MIIMTGNAPRQRRSVSLCYALTITVFAGTPLLAQTPAPDSLSAAAAISTAEIARHVAVITDDSIGGRDTPSEGLDRTARYVADQFRALGLEPADSGRGRWIKPYPLPGRSGLSRWSHFKLRAKNTKGGKPVIDHSGERLEIGSDQHAWFSVEEAPAGATASIIAATDTLLDSSAPGAQGGGQGWEPAEFYGPPPFAVAGPHTPESIRQAALRDKMVIYVPSPHADSATQAQVLQLLRAANHVVIVADEDAAAWAARRRAAATRPLFVLEAGHPDAQRRRRWAVYVWAPAIARNLAVAGLDLTEARTATSPIVRELNAIAMLDTKVGADSTAPSAPNVLGMLRGRQQDRVVLLTAHMDDTGFGSGTAGRAAPARDDNAAGVAGLIALAKAFKQAGVQPRSTIVFAAVSGGAKDHWGSSVLADQWGLYLWESLHPQQMVGLKPLIHLNLDALAGGPRDTIYVDGLREVELPIEAWAVVQHPDPELGLTVVDGGSVTTPVSDHFAFVRKWQPSLYLHGAEHDASAKGGGVKASAADMELVARRVRFAFALTREFAGAEQTARWSAAGRERLRTVLGQ